MEGVMMKGAHSVATAVRSETGEITVESKYIKPLKEKNKIWGFPFIRGIVNLVTQLYEGTGILLRSAEVYGDFAEPSKFEKKIAEKFKINPLSALMAFSVVLGILLAVGLFVFLPNFLTGLIFEIPNVNTHPVLQSLTEGAIMLTIFITYILVVSLMKDIRRVFMYHGAEHKVINCYEHGLELTPENAKKMSKAHSRCGTTFMFIVVTVSIIVFALVNWILSLLGWLMDSNVVNAFIKLGVKLLFLPVVAGVSYEILKLLAKSDCLLFRILRAPGMLLQKLTTKEPTLDMLEVSITAFNTVMEMEANPNLPERKFEIKITVEKAYEYIKEIAETAEQSDFEWILVEVLGVNRSCLQEVKYLNKEQFNCAREIARKMKDGAPLQYALGNAEFFGFRLAVTHDVLIPRPETEELVEKALNIIKVNNFESALDLCTGSGAIAIAINKLSGIAVTATDISEKALIVAKANALNNGANVEFLCGDLFEAVKNKKFDIIISNPPYIPSKDIKGLDKKVKSFEPILALDGGEDGLNFYRRIKDELKSYLADNGVLVFEFGIGQSEAIKDIFGQNVEILKDIEGVDRIAVVR